jgi:E3 ubiquitin-protein ligase HECTD1
VKNTRLDHDFFQVEDVEVELNDPNWTIFRAVQQLIQLADLGSRQEKLRRIWEPTYTLVDHIIL